MNTPLTEFHHSLQNDKEILIYLNKEGDGYITFNENMAPITGYKLLNPGIFKVPRSILLEWGDITEKVKMFYKDLFLHEYSELFERIRNLDNEAEDISSVIDDTEDKIYALKTHIKSLHEDLVTVQKKQETHEKELEELERAWNLRE